MNNSKKINVNYSSLVGLKAELLRKQTEVKNAKVSAEVIPNLNQTKHKVKNKKPKTKKLKVEQELTDTDDIKAHKKSKLMLEAKARLYENLKKLHSNKNEHFLVDFENKSESEDEAINSDDYEDINSDPEEDWVEYEDCFGRTRKCLRKDLPTMREKDEFVKHEVMKKSQAPAEIDDARPESIKIVPKEPEIEIMRRKWEEQTEKLADKMNIHYQDVLFDEARAHGVGYYEFSQDEEIRAKQQANLDVLRKETIQKQKEMQSLKEMKEKMEENRLKAARIRQRIRAGLPPEPTEEELEEKNKTATETTEAKPDIEEQIEPDQKKEVENKEQNSLVEIENKIKAFGELLGKRTQWREMSQEEWVHKRRRDRIGEFAPAYDNFKSAGYLQPKNKALKNDESRTLSDDNSSDKNILNTSNATVTPNCETNSLEDNIRSTWIEVNTSKVDEPEKNVPYSETCEISSPSAIPVEIVNNVDTESLNDSDMIGPMPLCMEPPEQHINLPQTFLELPEDVRTELASIDFSKPPPNLRTETSSKIISAGSEEIVPTPVLLPNPENLPVGYHLPTSMLLNSEINPDLSEQTFGDSSLNTSNDQAQQYSLNEDRITAGLKYLRANFENKKYS